MNPKKPKKRYHTIQQITREIDAAHAKVEKLLKMADNLDHVADGLIQAGPALEEDAAGKREEADKLRKQAFRLEQNRIPHLKQKCGEFLTGQLPFMDDDPSIPSKG